MENVRVLLLIEGKVQGVFYRAFTRDIAFRLTLSGWVKNLPDGRVEAVFEGDKEAIEGAIRECLKGPYGAKVSNIDVRWEKFIGDLNGFAIKY